VRSIVNSKNVGLSWSRLLRVKYTPSYRIV